MPKKYHIDCPHCQGKFEYTPPTKIKGQKQEKNPVYTQCVDFWLNVFHSGWSFGAVQGKSLKAIIAKHVILLSKAKRDLSIESQVQFFQFFCQHLPEYYRDKDLQVLNSKHNEIFEQMKKGQTTLGNDGYNQTPSGKRGFSASRYR